MHVHTADNHRTRPTYFQFNATGWPSHSGWVDEASTMHVHTAGIRRTRPTYFQFNFTGWPSHSGWVDEVNRMHVHTAGNHKTRPKNSQFNVTMILSQQEPDSPPHDALILCLRHPVDFGRATLRLITTELDRRTFSSTPQGGPATLAGLTKSTGCMSIRLASRKVDRNTFSSTSLCPYANWNLTANHTMHSSCAYGTRPFSAGPPCAVQLVTINRPHFPKRLELHWHSLSLRTHDILAKMLLN
jgi:hypothetical protein